MSKKTMAAAPMEETPVGAAEAAAPAAAPAPAPATEPVSLPPTGGCWVRYPDGRLERVNEDGTPWVDPAAAAEAEPATGA